MRLRVCVCYMFNFRCRGATGAPDIKLRFVFCYVTLEFSDSTIQPTSKSHLQLWTNNQSRIAHAHSPCCTCGFTWVSACKLLSSFVLYVEFRLRVRVVAQKSACRSGTSREITQANKRPFGGLGLYRSSAHMPIQHAHLGHTHTYTANSKQQQPPLCFKTKPIEIEPSFKAKSSRLKSAH